MLPVIFLVKNYDSCGKRYDSCGKRFFLDKICYSFVNIKEIIEKGLILYGCSHTGLVYRSNLCDSLSSTVVYN